MLSVYLALCLSLWRRELLLLFGNLSGGLGPFSGSRAKTLAAMAGLSREESGSCLFLWGCALSCRCPRGLFFPWGLMAVVVRLACLTPMPPISPSLAGCASPAPTTPGNALSSFFLILTFLVLQKFKSVWIFSYALVLQWSKSAESPQTLHPPPPFHTLISLLVLLEKLLPWETSLEWVMSHRRNDGLGVWPFLNLSLCSQNEPCQ